MDDDVIKLALMLTPKEEIAKKCNINKGMIVRILKRNECLEIYNKIIQTVQDMLINGITAEEIASKLNLNLQGIKEIEEKEKSQSIENNLRMEIRKALIYGKNVQEVAKKYHIHPYQIEKIKQRHIKLIQIMQLMPYELIDMSVEQIDATIHQWAWRDILEKKKNAVKKLLEEGYTVDDIVNNRELNVCKKGVEAIKEGRYNQVAIMRPLRSKISKGEEKKEIIQNNEQIKTKTSVQQCEKVEKSENSKNKKVENKTILQRFSELKQRKNCNFSINENKQCEYPDDIKKIAMDLTSKQINIEETKRKIGERKVQLKLCIIDYMQYFLNPEKMRILGENLIKIMDNNEMALETVLQIYWNRGDIDEAKKVLEQYEKYYVIIDKFKFYEGWKKITKQLEIQEKIIEILTNRRKYNIENENNLGTLILKIVKENNVDITKMVIAKDRNGKNITLDELLVPLGLVEEEKMH